VHRCRKLEPWRSQGSARRICWRASSRSASTIRCTSSLKLTSGLHPSLSRALVGSPIS